MGSKQKRPGRSLAALAAAGVLLAGGCASGDDDAEDASAAEEPAEEPADEPAGAMADESADDRGLDDSVDGGEPANGDTGAVDPIDLGQVGRDVIIEMDVTLSSDDIERSVATLSATARRLGGGLASSQVDFAADRDEEGGFAVLVLKVPPDTVDDLLAGLDSIGTVVSINQRAEDVTEQLVDLDVRIENARESVVNVREFMDRAEDLSDLVTLEGELIRRQTDLERLEAQRRNLGERVALSTITVQIVPAASVPQDDDRTMADAFADGWSAFVAVVAALAFALAAALPFLALGVVVVAGWWWLNRRRGRAASRAATAPPADPNPGRTSDPATDRMLEETSDPAPADATASRSG